MNDQEVKKAIEAALETFPNQPLAEAASHVFEVLGYTSQRSLKLSPNNLDNFIATFAQGKTLNEQYALPGEWQSIDFLFQLTDDEIRAAGNQQFRFESKGTYNGAAINSYLFFALELQGHHYTRTALAGITRELNKLFAMPALVLFRHGETLTLAVISRRLHKRDEGKDVLEKVTLIQDILCGNTHRAHIEILFDLSLGVLHDKHGFTNFVELQAAWEKTLDTSALNKRFYQELANWYFWALPQARFPRHAPKDADGRDSLSLIRLITRVIFCWFLKEKGLLPNALFDPRQAPALLNDFSPQESTYYQAILQNLFFATLNQEMNKREFRKDGQHFMAHNLYRYRCLLKNPDVALKLFASIPFMNGGLFECLDKTLGTREKPNYVRIDGFSDRNDNVLRIPNDLFFGPEREVDLSEAYGAARYRRARVCGLIHTLGRYKFTVAENTPIEEEIALDPELLGKVFENLLAAHNPETGATARKQTGSFYTRREIVHYMVDESLLASLKTKFEDACPSAENNEERLRHLFAYNDQPHQFTTAEVDALIEAIDHLKILDPACGSGAFPMGILHKLVFVLGKLDPGNQRWKARQLAKAAEIPDPTVRDRVLADIEQTFGANELDYGRKLYLIENCIYGVDIQSIAVQIAKLRFFISLVVDQKVNPQVDNIGIRPLPNLETKFVAANTLIALDRPGQLHLRNLNIDAKEAELRRVRERHFLARTPATKAKCREQDANLRAEIAELLKNDGWDTTTARKLAAWDPYDQNASAGFFDPEWMFGLTNGFDVAIGNPPYVRPHKLSSEFKEELWKRFTTFEKKADLYVCFIEKSLLLLRPQGAFAFIVSNGCLRLDSFELLRKFVLKSTVIHRIVDFDEDVFEAATVKTCILLLQRSAAADHIVQAAVASSASQVDSLTFRSIPQSKFVGNYKCIFDLSSDAALDALKNKMKLGSVDLGQMFDISFGLKTGDDDKFLSKSATTKQHRKLLRGEDVGRYTAVFKGEHVWYVPEKMRAHKQTARPGTSDRFEQPKVLIRDTGGGLMGTFDGDNFYVKDVLIIEDAAKSPLLLKKLTGVLNSSLMRFYYNSSFPTLHVQRNELASLPIKQSLSEKDTLQDVPRFVDRILKAKQANAAADTSALEWEIDDCVYRLYGLTPDEIRLVEESMPSSDRLAEPAPK